MLHLYWIEVIRRKSPLLPPLPKPFSPESLLRCRGCAPPPGRAAAGRRDFFFVSSSHRLLGCVVFVFFFSSFLLLSSPLFSSMSVEIELISLRGSSKIAQANSAKTTFNESSFVEFVPPESETWKDGKSSFHSIFYQHPSFVSRRSL